MADQTAQYLARFRSATPEQRRDAIIKLGKSGDTRAILLLQQIASVEPVPELRNLTQKAIQHLQSLSQSAQSGTSYNTPPSDSSPSSALSVEPAATAIEPARPVSARQSQIAKSRLDYALSLHMSGQNDKALSVLAEAANADPAILGTQMGRNLAMALTDEPSDRAIEIVNAKRRDPKTAGQATRPVFKLSASADLFNTAIELLGLLIVLVLSILVGELAFVRSANAYLSSPGSIFNVSLPDASATEIAQIQQSSDAPSAKETEIANVQQFQQIMESSSTTSGGLQQTQAKLSKLLQSASTPVALFGFALALGVPVLLFTILGILVTYVVGILLGGVGGVLRFIRYQTRAYILVFALSLIGTGLAYWVGINPNLPKATQDTLGGLAGLLLLVDAILGLFIFEYAAARAHEFGFLKATLSIIGGNVVLIVLIFVVVLGPVLNSLHS